MRSSKADWQTILVVDDAAAIRKMVCAMLTQTGYNCLEASDGAEALRLLDAADDVHLVLTDMVMPNMDGAELAKHLSRIRPTVRILFMSGYTEDPVVRSLDRTSFLFLSKPFTATTLMEKVRQALDRPWQGLPDGRLGFSS
jgi:CheY-like chemotaxis protein